MPKFSALENLLKIGALHALQCPLEGVSYEMKFYTIDYMCSINATQSNAGLETSEIQEPQAILIQ